jgi:tripartite-type tricarboxylate transporter receptor subunit TctC
MTRRTRRWIAAVLSAWVVPQGAAQSDPGTAYPERPVRVIVPVAPGGGTDLIARVVLSRLSDTLGGPFIIDNRAGAGGILGNEIVARAQPDGYTLLFTYAAHTIVPFIYRKIPYDVYNDFTPVTMVGVQPLFLALHPSVKANTVQELVALAKARPRELNVALATPSSSGALAAELFKILTKTEMISVPFKGGAPAMTALLAGEVQLIFGTPPVVVPFAKSGKVKVLAVTGKERVRYLPEVPTLVEVGIQDFNTAPWQGLIARAGTPRAVVDKLYRQIADVLKNPTVRERFEAAGTDVVGSSPAEFADLIRRELAQNSKVIKAVGMKAD